VHKEHVQKNTEFNVITEPILSLHDIASLLSKIPGKKRILECGTKSYKGRGENSYLGICDYKFKTLFDGIDCDYVMTDYESGDCVEIVSDLQNPKELLAMEGFDLIINVSVLEHVKYPILACHNMCKLLKPEGYIFLGTHQTFHLHGYKYDYFRFSREALKSLFPPTMNMKVLSSSFANLVQIIPDDKVSIWNYLAEAYLNVDIVVKKIGPTPDTFIFDLQD
jgi:SAM-dependent methyltransferase